MDKLANAPPFLRFGPFQLDSRAGEVHRYGVRVRMPEQSLQILLLLLEQPGTVVLREEIRKKLWPDDTIVDFEHSINAAVKRLRRSLQDSAETPRYVETVPKRGYRFVGDVERPADGTLGSSEASAQQINLIPPTRPAVLVQRATWIGAVVFTIICVWFFLPRALRKSERADRIRFSIFHPENTFFGGLPAPAVSPDGRRIVFAVYAAGAEGWTLWMRSLDTVSPFEVPGTERGALPFWSPDSRSIGFFTRQELKRIDLDGPSGPEKAVTLCAAEDNDGGTWNREGTIVFSTGGATLYRISDRGGSPVPVTKADVGIQLYPWFLPDGRHFLFEVAPPTSDRVVIRVGSLDSLQSKVLFEADSNAIFVQGRLVYVRGDTLFSQAFDTGRLVTTGGAVRLAEHIAMFAGFGNFSAAQNGPLVYLGTAGAPPFELVWFDRNGKRLSTLTGVRSPPFLSYPLSLSPDQTTVAFPHREKDSTDIWLHDSARNVSTRLTFDSAKKVAPVWSPDNRTVVFASAAKGHFDLYRRAAYGNEPQELVYGDNADKYPTSWSKDGRYLLYDREDASAMETSIWLLPLFKTARATDSKPVQLITGPGRQMNGQFSPDGRWVAYESDESGQREIYVVRFRPDASVSVQKQQVSTKEAWSVRWRADGRELFYISARQLLAVPVNATDNGLRIGEAKQIIGPLTILGYDVSSDGQRLLMRVRTTRITSQPLTVVQNWATDLSK